MTEIYGKWKNTCGKAIIADPCYALDFYDNQFYTLVKKGEWKSKYTPGELFTYHKLFDENNELEGKWEKSPIKVVVDSEQLGIFDLAKYPKDSTGSYSNKESFYRKCYDISFDPGMDHSGVITYKKHSMGVVAKFDKGKYTCWSHTYRGERDAFKIMIYL